jgi:hypothetical protein
MTSINRGRETRKDRASASDTRIRAAARVQIPRLRRRPRNPGEPLVRDVLAVGREWIATEPARESDLKCLASSFAGPKGAAQNAGVTRVHRFFFGFTILTLTACSVSSEDAIGASEAAQTACPPPRPPPPPETFQSSIGNYCAGEQAGCAFDSPLVLALGDAPIEFAGHAVPFDFYGDGSRPLLDWIKGPAGFLALDVNGNGTIDDGSELFGRRMPSRPGETILANNGFTALAAYDSNVDGVIDRRDRIFPRLLVWVDANEDGVSQPSELHHLAELGITELDLRAVATPPKDPNASFVGSVSTFTQASASCTPVERSLVDVWFAIEPRVGSVPDPFVSGRHLYLGPRYDGVPISSEEREREAKSSLIHLYPGPTGWMERPATPGVTWQCSDPARPFKWGLELFDSVNGTLVQVIATRNMPGWGNGVSADVFEISANGKLPADAPQPFNAATSLARGSWTRKGSCDGSPLQVCFPGRPGYRDDLTVVAAVDAHGLDTVVELEGNVCHVTVTF